MTKGNIGVIGLSVMGANLASNIADHGWQVSVYNRSREKTDVLLSEYGKENMVGQFTLEEFVDSLELPRKIFLMVQAGDAVDAVINSLVPLLSEGDIVIDGGNSFFGDTIRREKSLKEKGLVFVGMGVSGGEEGARRGPSIMPGGSVEAWGAIRSIFESIAAKDFHGNPCITHLGTDGAGHYVKMVHNGIEYIDMQLIAEMYWIMKNGLMMSNDEIADQFEEWNRGRLNSFLIEITAKILRTRTEDGVAVIDTILDSAGNKGTGKWTSEEIFELGTPGFGMVSAVLARYGSAHKKERVILAKAFPKRSEQKISLKLSQLENALYVSKIFAYAQGYELLREASKVYGWQLNFQEISRIWEGGCIIRAVFLEELEKTFVKDNDQSLLVSELFKQSLETGLYDLRLVASTAVMEALSVPALLAGVSYFDTMTSEKLCANMIQAQRDFFGAHTFQKEIDGEFAHYEWNEN